MKILYIASNPEGAPPLQIEREINALQEKLDQADAAANLDLRVYSHLHIDELPDVIARLAPDVIHFAAHGEDDAIVLSHQERGHVALDGNMLGDLLGALTLRPKLIILNACSSAKMAEALTAHADFVIGTNAPISNIGARAMTATLYARLAAGARLGAAFEAAASMLRIVDRNNVQAALYPADAAALAQRMQLADPLRILACFPTIEKWLDQKRVTPPGAFNVSQPHVQFGLAGAPESTRLIQFFTDDPDIEPEKNESLADARGWMLEDRPIRGEVWLEDFYSYYGDMWWYGTVVTSERQIQCAHSTTSAALRRYYLEEEWRGTLPPAIATLVTTAIANLDANDGSRQGRYRPRASAPPPPKKRAPKAAQTKGS